MIDEEKKPSSFATVPGILTGLAVLIMVLAGFLWYWRAQQEKPVPEPAPTPTPAPELSNLAPTSHLTASHASPDAPPGLAADGDIRTSWNAGGFSPQWIDVGLQKPSNIVKLRLIVNQAPAGDTRHVVLGHSASGGDYEVLYEFKGITEDKGALEYSPPNAWKDIDHLRIETTTSPSWVSWREIQIDGYGKR
jgi:hypothetical protein